MLSREEFLEQLALIREAPYPLVALTLAIIGTVWFIENWAYSQVLAGKDAVIQSKDTEIGSLNERIKLRDDQLSDKFKSTPPGEAKELINKLKKQIDDISPHHIGDAQGAKMIRILSEGTPSQVTISYDASCGKCQVLQLDLLNIFSKSGWTVIPGVVMGPSYLPKSGITIQALAASVQGEYVRKAFEAADIAVDQKAAPPGAPGIPPVKITLTTPE